MNYKTGKNLSIIAIFCMGLFLTSAATHLAYQSEKVWIGDIFDDASAYRFKYIEDTVQYDISTLESFADFYTASVNVDKGGFESFAKGALSRNPAISEFRKIDKVTDDERAAFELNARKTTGIADFHIKDVDKNGRFIAAARRKEYYPICYIAYPPGHKYDYSRIIGFDVSGVSQIRDALNKARDTGKLAATGEIKFPGEIFTRNIARMFLPIYKNGALSDSVEERRQNLIGFVPMLYSVAETIERSLSGIPSVGIDIAIYEERPTTPPLLLYFRPAPSRKGPDDPAVEKDLLRKRGVLLWSGSTSVADTKWLIVCSPSPDFYEKHRMVLPWIVFIAGLFFTFLVSGYFASVIGRTKVIEALVRERTDQLRESEEKIRQANRLWADTFNSISDFVFILDKDSIIKNVNRAFLDVIKLGEKDVVGKHCYEIVHKTSAPWVNCPHQKTLIDKKPHTEEVYDPVWDVPLLISTSPILDDKGDFLGTVHIAKDISKIKKTEEALKKANEELEIEARDLARVNEDIKKLYKDLAAANERLKKMDTLKSDFVSVVSHELRTPMAIMKEGVALVLDNITGQIGEKTRDTLDMVFTNINRLANLINDLLDISKIESGKIQVNKSVADINNLVRDTVEKWKLTAGKKSQEIKVTGKPGRIEAYIDSDKIIQIINNLVSNAIKFTPEAGSISVEVKDDDAAVEVSVSDTGIGISAEDLPKVFEKFSQFNRAIGPGAKGTGLGLAISRELVALHEGYIKVESKPGIGSTFTFTIPKKDSETIFREHVESGIKEASSEGASFSIISVRIPSFFDIQQGLGEARAKKMLEELKGVMAGSLRRKDDVVIEGVMEFVIMLMAADKKATEAVRKRVEEAVRSYLAASKDRIVKDLSVNIGIASYPSDADKTETLLNKARGVIKV